MRVLNSYIIEYHTLFNPHFSGIYCLPTADLIYYRMWPWWGNYLVIHGLISSSVLESRGILYISGITHRTLRVGLLVP